MTAIVRTQSCGTVVAYRLILVVLIVLPALQLEPTALQADRVCYPGTLANNLVFMNERCNETRHASTTLRPLHRLSPDVVIGALLVNSSVNNCDRCCCRRPCVSSVASPPAISASIYTCADRRLLYPSDSLRIYTSRHRRSLSAFLVALILLLGGVESNPGPEVLKLGVFNAHSARHRAAVLHDVIADHHLDLMVVTETWL